MKHRVRAMLSIILSVATVLGMMPFETGGIVAYANSDPFVKTEANTCIGTGLLGSPKNNAGDDKYRSDFSGYGGGWSYVYFGKYNGEPLRYRVLDKNSADYGVEGGSVLIDCDNVIDQMPFYGAEVNIANEAESNKWENSKLKSWLNGDTFLGNDSCFTAVERNAVAESKKATASATDGSGAFERREGLCVGQQRSFKSHIRLYHGFWYTE